MNLKRTSRELSGGDGGTHSRTRNHLIDRLVICFIFFLFFVLYACGFIIPFLPTIHTSLCRRISPLAKRVSVDIGFVIMH